MNQYLASRGCNVYTSYCNNYYLSGGYNGFS